MPTDDERPPAQAADDAGSSPTATPETRRPSTPRRTPLTQHVGRVVMIALAVLFGIFAVVNAQRVDFDWVFGSTEVVKRGDEIVSGGVPLILLLVVAFLAGGVVGRISGWRRSRRLKRDVPEDAE